MEVRRVHCLLWSESSPSPPNRRTQEDLQGPEGKYSIIAIIVQNNLIFTMVVPNKIGCQKKHNLINKFHVDS